MRAGAADAWSGFATLRGEAATYRIGPDEGSYEGLSLGLGAGTTWVGAEARLPGYRLVRGDATRFGAGDPLLRLRLTPLRGPWNGGAWELGAILGGILPLGDADQGFGMGHAMLLPGVHAGAHGGRWSAALELTYAQALGEHEHGASQGAHAHHHHGTHSATMGAMGPLVDPMTASELGIGAAAAYRVVAEHGVRVGTHAALPVDDSPRWVFLFGPELRFGALGAAAEWHLPLAGDPFSNKVVLELRGSY